MENVIRELSIKLYRLFVVNPYAAAIQQDDGKYITKYIPFTPIIIESMLSAKGAIGCYQQGFKNGFVKWVCFDFDCRDKDNPNVADLYSEYVVSFLKKLEEYEISYLTEFSGRRGIHVWVIFDDVITKSIAYTIVNKLISEMDFDSDFLENYAIDLFPATDSALGNKVGKQVKLPLSFHKSGSQSFFFYGILDSDCIYDSQFYEKQLEFLSEYRLNSLEFVCKRLSIVGDQTEEIMTKYKKFKILNDIDCSIDDIEKILIRTNVYKAIFDRIKSGTPIQRDWFVLLGTLGIIDKSGQILSGVFSKSPAYNKEITDKNIEKWKTIYYPATFKHLYHIYGLILEEGIDENMTGLEYLLINLQQEFSVELVCTENINMAKYNEMELLNSIEYTVDKECKYILFNDENVDVSIWNELNDLKGYDLIKISNDVELIKNAGNNISKNKKWLKYDRYESENKIRTLVSLGAYERVLTTHLALQLAYRMNLPMNSYSYNIIFTSKKDIFYNWFASWGNYLDQIKVFLEIPFLSEWGVMVIDIKSFYDNIDFLAVYDLLQSKMNDYDKNIFKYLIAYNEEIMRDVNGSRIGVPQGPAYARIISEMFLNTILNKTTKRLIDMEYKMYRYVDDIIVFYSSEVDGNMLFNEIKNSLVENGLEINKMKSRDFGSIKTLSEENRNKILRKDVFNYQLQISDINRMLMDEEKIVIFRHAINNKFDINDVAYLFSKNTDDFYTRIYFKKFKKNIFSDRYGRGSIYASFYCYLYKNKSMLMEAIAERCFELIDKTTLNFKNCISQLYLAIQNEEVSNEDIMNIHDTFLSKINLDEVSIDDRTTINSIVYWR